MYRERGFREGELPVTEQVAKELLCLPMVPELTEEQIEHVAHSLKEVSG